ncbi:hypothetical protein H072_3148 [Dactylellina haptotyla CBS 200.50]|uniref:NADP-dependent oxidoreductase domain-containing protein n=1 Tax=Dactylellina haptotyla (strain CBS 200.50) TaxID=1284197 RepID=S8C540_DACHA|nr:hypothetical protein H072_3148 [Dactylellina haptotyla CBS 200.50]
MTSHSYPLPRKPGVQIPAVGFGVFQSADAYASALGALETGYRHLDTAEIYYSEPETGKAVSEFLAANPTLNRADIFICSKLWEVDLSLPGMPPTFESMGHPPPDGSGAWKTTAAKLGRTQYTTPDAIAGFTRSLEKMGPGIEYIDLYLLHNPRPGKQARVDAWLGLQEMEAQGKVRALGVSNWSKRHLEELVADARVTSPPTVNQIEFHPWCQQRELVEYCKQQGIVVVAYSPLAQGTRLGDPVVVEVAEKYGKTVAQVVLKWCLQSNVVIIPKSDNKKRMAQNMDLWGWELAEEDMEKINGLDGGIEARVGEWDPDAWE